MDSRKVTTDIALIAVFAALCAAFTLVPAFNVPGFPVPITLQTIAVALCGLVLGPWRGFMAVLLWQCVGFAGVPVFTNYKAGTEVLKGPTAGYLVGFLLSALAIGYLARLVYRRVHGRGALVVALFGVSIGCLLLLAHTAGIVGLMTNVKMPFAKALQTDLLFVPGDVLKAILSAGVAVSVHAAFPGLVSGRERGVVLLDEPATDLR